MAPVPHGFVHSQFDDTSTLIGRWRLQRQALRKQLLQLICSQLTSATRQEQEMSLENLCGELIDYISIGHFEIYSSLMRKHARTNHELQILMSYLYRCIGSSTDLVLDFNTSCERSHLFIGSKQMSESIAKLTRSLLVRFALEEQMLELTTGNDF
jgi:regulator of sigma D